MTLPDLARRTRPVVERHFRPLQKNRLHERSRAREVLQSQRRAGARAHDRHARLARGTSGASREVHERGRRAVSRTAERSERARTVRRAEDDRLPADDLRATFLPGVPQVEAFHAQAPHLLRRGAWTRGPAEFAKRVAVSTPPPGSRHAHPRPARPRSWCWRAESRSRRRSGRRAKSASPQPGNTSRSGGRVVMSRRSCTAPAGIGSVARGLVGGPRGSRCGSRPRRTDRRAGSPRGAAPWS